MQGVASKELQEPPWNDVTTVMMRNLPNKCAPGVRSRRSPEAMVHAIEDITLARYRQQMLLDELADAGFRAQVPSQCYVGGVAHSCWCLA